MRTSLSTRILGAVSAVALLAVGACSSGFSAGTNFDVGDGGGSSGGGSGSGSGGSEGGAGGGTGGGSGGGGAGEDGGSGGDGSSGGGSVGGSASAGGTLQRTTDGVGGLAGGVLATAGNAPLLNQTPAGSALQTVGTGLQTDGLAGLPVLGGPVGAVVTTADNTLNPLGKVVVLDRPIIGSEAAAATQLVGVSALSPAQTQGQLATVGVLSSGAGLKPAAGVGQLASADNLLNVSVGDRTLLGGGEGTALVGASVLSPTQAQGIVATAGLLSGGQASAAGPLAPVTGVVSGVTGAVGGVVQGATGLLGGLSK